MTTMSESPRNSTNPWMVTLLCAGVAAFVVALILGAAANAELGTFSPDTRAVATLSSWSNFLLTLGATALIGALVVGGVAWTLRNFGR